MARSRMWLSVITLLGLVSPVGLQAQDQDPFLLQASQGLLEPGALLQQLPAVYVTAASVAVTNASLSPEAGLSNEGVPPENPPAATGVATANTVSGTFTVTNGDNQPYSDLRYELIVVDGEQSYSVGEITTDEPDIYYRLPMTANINLGAQESQDITFTQEIPALAEASYRVRIQLLTSQGRALGWRDVPVVLGGSNAAFVKLTARGIVEGEIVNSQQPLTLSATVDTEGLVITEPLTPQITTSSQLQTNDLIIPVVTTQAPITLSSTGPQDITLPLSASAAPGAYMVSVSLLDSSGVPRSTIAEYTYVTRGVTASILNQSLARFESGRTPKAEVTFTVAGAADRESNLTGSVEIVLLSGDTVLATTESPLTLAAGQTQTGTAMLALERRVCTPFDIRTTVTDGRGTVLASEQVPSEAAVSCFANIHPLVWIGLAVVGIVLAMSALFMISRRRRYYVVGSFLLAATVAAGLMLSSHLPALANGIQWQSGSGGYALSLFINKPQHQSTASAALGLDYEARLTYASSNTVPVGAKLNVYILVDGGQVSSPNFRNWIRLGTSTAKAQNAQNPRTLSLAARLPLPNNYRHTTSTLWTAASVASTTSERSMYDLTWLTLDSPPGNPNDTLSGSCLVPAVTAANTVSCQQAQVTYSLKNSCGPSAARLPLDVMLVLDRSGSMGERNKLTDAKVAAQTLIDQLDVTRDRIGLVSYADTARLDSGLTSNLAQVKSSVNAMRAEGWTNVAGGVLQARSHLGSQGRAGTKQIILVLTDGIANRTSQGGSCSSSSFSSACTQEAIAQAATAKGAGISVFSVGFDLGQASVAREMLRQMASSESQFFNAPSANQLQAAFVTIAREITQITNVLASNTVFTYVLPAGVTYVLGSGSPAPTAIQGQLLRWDIGNVEVGDEPEVTFTVSVAGNQSQPLSVSPDTKIVYTDIQNQTQTVVAPVPSLTPLSCPSVTPLPICSDTQDNDNDGKIDAADPGCHTDRDADNLATYDPTDNSEADSASETPSTTPTPAGFDPGGVKEVD